MLCVGEVTWNNNARGFAHLPRQDDELADPFVETSPTKKRKGRGADKVGQNAKRRLDFGKKDKTADAAASSVATKIALAAAAKGTMPIRTFGRGLRHGWMS